MAIGLLVAHAEENPKSPEEKWVEFLKEKIHTNPDYAKAHNNLGAAYGNLGRDKEAAEAYKKAIRINPNDAKAHGGLGRAYSMLGDKEAALDEYKILKDLDQALANKLFKLITHEGARSGRKNQPLYRPTRTSYRGSGSQAG